jgi:hypothetical protein
MDSFPPDFNADTMFPPQSNNPELADIRRCIVASVKQGTGGRCEVRGTVINAKNTVYIDYSKLIKLGMYFRYLAIINQELSDLKFIVEYEISGKRVKFEEIDPFGKMPDVMLIGSKNDLQHLISASLEPK